MRVSSGTLGREEFKGGLKKEHDKREEKKKSEEMRKHIVVHLLEALR